MKEKFATPKKVSPIEQPKKETLFQISRRLGNKKDEKVNVIDMQRAIHAGSEGGPSFEQSIEEAAKRGANQYDGDFFIVVLVKKERLMNNVIRHFFVPRKSCPTPEFDQTVFKLHRSSGKLEFIWVIPDKEFCISLPVNYRSIVHDSADLIRFVCEFRDGTLERKARMLNNEPLEENLMPITP